MIHGTTAYDSDASEHERDEITCANQVQRNNVLRNTIFFGLQGCKESSAAIKLHSSALGNSCMKTAKSGEKNFTMHCSTWVKSLRSTTEWTDDKVPWP